MIERRSFLKALAVLPFIRHLPPVAAAVEEEDWEEFERAARPTPLPPSGVLGVVMGEPTAVTVTVPPERTLKITGSVYMPNGGTAAIKEDRTTLAFYQCGAGEALDVGTVIRPTMGSHTYRLECRGAVRNTPVDRPVLMVEDIDMRDVTGPPVGRTIPFRDTHMEKGNTA